MEVAWADPGRTEPMRPCPNGLNFVIADDRMMNKIRYNEVIRSGGLQEELGCSHEVVFKSGDWSCFLSRHVVSFVFLRFSYTSPNHFTGSDFSWQYHCR